MKNNYREDLTSRFRVNTNYGLFSKMRESFMSWIGIDLLTNKDPSIVRKYLKKLKILNKDYLNNEQTLIQDLDLFKRKKISKIRNTKYLDKFIKILFNQRKDHKSTKEIENINSLTFLHKIDKIKFFIQKILKDMTADVHYINEDFIKYCNNNYQVEGRSESNPTMKERVDNLSKNTELVDYALSKARLVVSEEYFPVRKVIKNPFLDGNFFRVKKTLI